MGQKTASIPKHVFFAQNDPMVAIYVYHKLISLQKACLAIKYNFFRHSYKHLSEFETSTHISKCIGNTSNISDWMTVDCLIVYNVLPIASHICFYQKSTTLAYVLEVTVTLSPLPKQALQILFYTTKFIFFPLTSFFSFTVFNLQCSILLYNICVFHLFNKEISHLTQCD